VYPEPQAGAQAGSAPGERRSGRGPGSPPALAFAASKRNRWKRGRHRAPGDTRAERRWPPGGAGRRAGGEAGGGKTLKGPRCRGPFGIESGSGGGIRTPDLRVMRASRAVPGRPSRMVMSHFESSVRTNPVTHTIAFGPVTGRRFATICKSRRTWRPPWSREWSPDLAMPQGVGRPVRGISSLAPGLLAPTRLEQRQPTPPSGQNSRASPRAPMLLTNNRGGTVNLRTSDMTICVFR